jgi:5'-nucleotidase
VSQYPKLEGRFLQIGGMSFAFDPKKPSGQRVDPRFVRIGDQYLEPLHTYRAVCKAYMCAGKDGYDVLKKQKTLVILFLTAKDLFLANDLICILGG